MCIRDSTNLVTTFPASEIANPEIFPSLLFYYGMLTITGTRGVRLILGIPNNNVRKQYYDFLLEEYQEKRHIDLNGLRDLFDDMAFDGHWQKSLEFIAHAYKENSSVRSAIEGERNIQGFFTAYLSVNAYYLTAPEVELNHGYCDLFLMPDLLHYEVNHSYIIELKYLSEKDSDAKAEIQWEEAVEQIKGYAAAPKVRQLIQNTKLHCIVTVSYTHLDVYKRQLSSWPTIPRTDGRPHGIQVPPLRKIPMQNSHVSPTEAIRTTPSFPLSGNGTVLSCAFRNSV